MTTHTFWIDDGNQAVLQFDCPTAKITRQAEFLNALEPGSEAQEIATELLRAEQ